MELVEVAVEPLEAHRRIADCLALVVADLATEEEPSGLQQMVSEEAEREEQQPLVTRWRMYRQHRTPCHASKHPCGVQKSQCLCHSLLRTR